MSFSNLVKINKKTVIFLAVCAAFLCVSIPLLESDSMPFFLWWLCIFLIGAGFFSVTSKLFSTFSDGGWIFSKALGILISGFLMFALCRAGIMPFTATSSLACVIISVAVCIAITLFLNKRKKGDKAFKNKTDISPELIVFEEMIFIIVFLMWTYFTGFHPEALSTEKFMDYGFMAAMMRDTSLPAVDIWHASDGINYYYGGQYYAVFLTKLTGTTVNVTYNLAKCMVAAFAFVMPFAIVWQMFNSKRGEDRYSFKKGTAVALFAGAAVSLAGNVHYVLYGLFGSVFKLSGYESYWFPSSTRYIGHNPETSDSCIHEFPSYSFVLGDLHAHVVNIMFVLLFLGILYAWLRKKEAERYCVINEKSTIPALLKDTLKDAHIWLLAFFIGCFKWTNYWDFVIYFTVAVIAYILFLIRQNTHVLKEALLQFFVRLVILIIVSTIAAIPFTSAFVTMVSGVGICVNHSAFYQMVILWGLPVLSVAALFVFVLCYVKRKQYDCTLPEKMNPIKRFISGMTLSDMMALLMGICAIGLILIPEIVYVKDIYENGYARSNTMFKLTYQAYIMFAMSMIYSLFRIISSARKIAPVMGAGLLLFVFILTLGYFPYSVKCWFGDVSNHDKYEGLDATAYLSTEMPDDAQAIYWLDENIEGNPVVLETDGVSYTEYCRVSAMTGLPTVIGWYTHEWLWRNNVAEQNVRISEVQEIYTSDDADRVAYLIDKYNIEYIFVGSKEREKYGDLLNETMLHAMGTEVFRGATGENPAYVLKID